MSVSLMVIVFTHSSPGARPYPAPHQNEPRIDAIDGAKGVSRSILTPRTSTFTLSFEENARPFCTLARSFCRPGNQTHGWGRIGISRRHLLN
jgi:hypothetical protein